MGEITGEVPELGGPVAFFLIAAVLVGAHLLTAFASFATSLLVFVVWLPHAVAVRRRPLTRAVLTLLTAPLVLLNGLTIGRLATDHASGALLLLAPLLLSIVAAALSWLRPLDARALPPDWAWRIAIYSLLALLSLLVAAVATA